MQFCRTAEQAQLLALARDWVALEVTPHARDWDRREGVAGGRRQRRGVPGQ